MTWKSIFASAPFGILAVRAGNLFSLVCSHALPSTFAHGAVLLAGQGIMAVLGIIGFAWNVLCIVPSETWESITIFFVAFIVDLLLGVTLIISVGIQSIYVPHTQGGCGNAERWQVYDNGTSLFTFVGDIRQESAEEACQEFFSIWCLGIITGLLSLFGAYANWVRFWRLYLRSRYPYRRTSDYHPVIDGNCCVPAPTTYINALITLGVQYFQKWKIRREAESKSKSKSLSLSSGREGTNLDSGTALALRHIPLQDSIALAKSSQRVSASRLEQLLSSYPIFVSIVRELHYTDLIRLSQTSSGMYQRILGNSKPVSLPQIKLLCCDRYGRSLCWSCETLICVSCRTYRYTPRSVTASHLHYCKPYCTTCYYRYLYYCARRRHRVLDKCHSPRPVGNFLADLCALCAQEADDNVAAPRDKREKREEKELLKLSRERKSCTSCDVRLKKNGPRWWACSNCRSGCLSHYHPAWMDEDEEDRDGASAND